MRENINKSNNNVHLFGFINEVRVNPVGDDGRYAINLKVCTHENYTVGEGENAEKKDKATYHDVSIFTDDKKAVKAYEKIGKEVAAEGDARKAHTVSLDGFLVNRDKPFKEGEGSYPVIHINAKLDAVKPDAKQEKEEPRNSTTIVGNIGSVRVYEDQNFATVSVAHNYRVEGQEKDQTTWLDVRVDGRRKGSAEIFEQIRKGDLKSGDFIRVGGQLHNRKFEDKEGRTRYMDVLDMTRCTKLEKKEAVAEKQEAEQKADKKAEVKAEKKATSRKAVSNKAAASKKATTAKKPAKGQSIG